MLSIKMQVPDLASMAEQMRERIEATVAKTALAVEADVKASMIESTPEGIIYKHGKVTHQASGPGQPPAIDTGYLINHIAAKELAPMQWSVSAGAEYAAALEYGYPPNNLAARPYMRPAADRAREPFKAAIIEALKP
jgi:hypothetical protein